MDLMQLGTQLLSENLGDATGGADLEGALGALSSGDGGLNLGGIVSGMMGNGGLQDMVGSWLGDGDNDAIDPSQLGEIFQNENLLGFAEKLGLDLDSALPILAKVLPQLVDKSSSGGALLDSIGGLDGVMDFAKKLF